MPSSVQLCYARRVGHGWRYGGGARSPIGADHHEALAPLAECIRPVSCSHCARAVSTGPNGIRCDATIYAVSPRIRSARNVSPIRENSEYFASRASPHPDGHAGWCRFGGFSPDGMKTLVETCRSGV